MSTEPQTNEEAVYYEAVGKTADEREAYLQAACGHHAALLARVRTLLKAREIQDGFMEPPLLDPAIALNASAVIEGPGTIIGRYKLLEKIGEGGMAVVYMAEQEQPLRRKVALKIIKLGMDTRQVIARFEAERQALALMDHPCIAKVFDAGATETGRPYFVMELVQGLSITGYCDRNSLSTKDRLRLFLQVCQAVQHAHTKGIIHRDLKPSNIMVTHHDGQPLPKVIDFGIAKAINQKLTEKTLFTRYAHLIGTPAYMSPEQAELSDLDIDTRTDIYSMGVLLYELLTGTTPFSEEELRKAGYIEMQRVIREQEPVKPSTRIRMARRSTGILPVSSMGVPPMTSDHGQDARGTHGRDGRATHGRDAHATEVRGDLDWIVMKTLEKDRTRRYETASGLAEDIRRHLEHEPVLAHGRTAAYRLRKFLRRHRTQVLTTSALALLSVAAAVLLLQWYQDRQRLEESTGLRDAAILSQAREQHAKADRQTALATMGPILESRHVGPEARLLQAGILVDERRFDEARTIAISLLQDRPEIAGTAYALLARILWESESLDVEKLQQFDEYCRQAERLLPETAEAYYLRAMTAPTIKEQFAALDKALQLDPHHYEARRLRAFTYYASRQYDCLRDDALVMTVLRDQDPLGYSLRATAGQELGRYADAIADYNSAMACTLKDSPQYLDLATHRCEVLLRMGDYEHAGAETRDCSERWPDTPVFQYHLFSALTALGNYDKAADLFRKIVSRMPTAREAFWSWATAYVFDTLAAGQSWHPTDHEPTGAAFLPLVEAEETYRILSAKGRLIVRDGFSAQWSPDGKRLAFSLGVLGRSGVAVYDSDTKQTDLLIVPGKYPKWSPDGQYIAFVRDRQFLRVPEFMAADPRNQPPAPADEEVWVMNFDGTQPRRLAPGVWPSWSRDSTCIYYRSRPDSILYSISIVEEAAAPKQIMPCPGFNPSVSPDNRYLAYLEGTSLKVVDLDSQTVVSQWPLPVPSYGWGGPAWSPSSNELCLGGSGGLENRTGLWIYRLDRSEPAQTLSSPITIGSWSPDGRKLFFELGAPHYEVWKADLAPGVSATETLGPARTDEEHLRELVARQTRRIQADPLDAYAYSNRARLYDSLHDRVRASADMRRWSAAAGGRPPWDCRHTIDLPFDCELVFSAERPVDTTSTMSIAFGQKGKRKMKTTRISMLAISLLGLGPLSGLDAPPVYGDFVFGPPAHVGLAGYDDDYIVCGPSLSADGLELYFQRAEPVNEMYVARRPTPESVWGEPVKLGPAINTPVHEGGASISADGLSLYFGRENTGILVAPRATTNDEWGTPVSLGSEVNSAFAFGPSISADELELYFYSDRSGGFGDLDIWVTTRASVNDAWGTPVNLGPTVNSPYRDHFPSISPDGLALFFDSTRPGGEGDFDLYMSRRATKQNPWGTPVNLGPVISAGTAITPCISRDGSTLYFCRYGRGLGIWQAPITPLVDFNGDAKVDENDLTLLVTDWGKNNSACDIGPYAWGDGVVDEKDLKVLMESLMTPGSKAADVPCDVVLSWVSPSFADSHDVYLGTSFDEVNNATREDPCGVLVSEGQLETTYSPEGLLEFERTYYWRVDIVEVVVGSLEPVIYKGPVLSFTVEPFMRPIQNIITTASGSQAGMGPQNTVNGSGLDTNDGHSTSNTHMWQSANAAGPHWIQYEFDQVYTLHELWVWNSNQAIEPFIGFGAKKVKIEYSTDGTAWTQLEGVSEFARASGQAGYAHNTVVNFGGVQAKYVKLIIEANWGGVSPSTGLSEVRFFYIPDRSYTQP